MDSTEPPNGQADVEQFADALLSAVEEDLELPRDATSDDPMTTAALAFRRL